MRRIGSFLLIVSLFLTSCSSDINVSGDVVTRSETKVTLSLKAPVAYLNVDNAEAVSRGTDASKVNEEGLDNVWVLQFINGKFERKKYIKDGLTTTLDVKLSVNNADETSDIYVIANAGETAFTSNPLSESDFKTTYRTASTEDALQFTSGYLPMEGELSGFKVTGTIFKKDVELTRMLARIDVRYALSRPLAQDMVLVSARVCNIPDRVYYVSPASDTFFPETYTLHNSELTDLSGNTEGSLTYYVPDNRRGTGSNEGGEDSGKAGVKDATYVEIIGFYRGEEVVYHIYPGTDDVNDYNVKRNTYYVMNLKLAGVYDTDKRVQRIKTSNCYMVKPGGTIYIPVQRVNQTVALGEQLPDLASGWTSAVIWRDNPALSVTVSDELKQYGVLRVVTTDDTAQGNALVCITNDEGSILWSWHIWVTDYDPLADNETYKDEVWMDRNLGATTDVPGDVDALGLMYQWGRKDPFAAANGIVAGTRSLRVLYSGSSGNLVYNSLGTTPANVAVAPTGSGNNNLENSVRNPGIFYSCTSPSGDWYVNSSSESNNTLWGNVKTVYDPCPLGWKVPSVENFSDWSASATTWDETDLGRSVISVSGSWFPASGYRTSTTGALDTDESIGRYWSSSVDGASAACLDFDKDVVYSTGKNNRACGFAVRCVRE